MVTIWYGLLGLFFAAYLVLGGYDYGSGLLLARGGTDRRVVLTAVGPFFLGNEVWLVAAAGILFGAFPMLEGELLAGLYPAVALALAGVLTVTAAVQLRSRSLAGRPAWDRAIIGGSALAVLGWGAVLGGLLQGVPLHADGHVEGVGHVVTPFAAACAVTLLTLAAVHGAAFLALRLPGSGHAQTGRRLVPWALAAVAATTVVGLLSARVRDAVQRPAAAVPLLCLLVAALVVAGGALARGRPGLGFAATSVALAVPVALVGAATWPYALVSTADPGASLAVVDAAASGPTLRLLTWLAVPLVPVLLSFQVMSWWVFRGRIDGRAPVYW
ncbi:cytochrome d ubiquinol oxidase subunit II [Phytohabitans sp. ZYX-F-186]|uniref:Cytochrome d ubiquinol oxidase subunit II n=1 Tax=Phytohabitans maris TaxID=3071409 RepID=A0ABU0ZSQ5_9ACTN|nr:cytochrome d ubiquinol oxidase subunit II [Phytohabitans sp. ZYX-F-186]MDQ7910039.1 cytochrome d ubiquinol oxidase subunit II [Phytohabitans sp. ZYX-F-186]